MATLMLDLVTLGKVLHGSSRGNSLVAWVFVANHLCATYDATVNKVSTRLGEFAQVQAGDKLTDQKLTAVTLNWNEKRGHYNYIVT